QHLAVAALVVVRPGVAGLRRGPASPPRPATTMYTAPPISKAITTAIPTSCCRRLALFRRACRAARRLVRGARWAPEEPVIGAVYLLSDLPDGIEAGKSSSKRDRSLPQPPSYPGVSPGEPSQQQRPWVQMTDLDNRRPRRPDARAGDLPQSPGPKPVTLSAVVGAGACLLAGLVACSAVAVVGWLAGTVGGASGAVRVGALTRLSPPKGGRAVP